MAEKLRDLVVPTRYSRELKVYIQGDLKDRAGKIVFLTVHDVGTNHSSFQPFVNCGSMSEVRRKSIWIHVCLPGQDDKDENLHEGYEFPTLDGLAHDLVFILDYFNLRTVIAFGEGAGSNIICRFGLYYPNRCLGLVLIDCTSSTAGVDEYIKYTVFNWKEGGSKLVDKVLRHMTYHKTGSGSTENWKDRLNPVNLGKYLDVYLKRSDISGLLASNLKVETLLVNGAQAPNVGSTYAINRLNSRYTTTIVLDGVADPLYENPKNMTRALILFCKGCGALMGVPMVGLEKEFRQVNEKQALNETQMAIASRVVTCERMQNGFEY